MSRQLSILLPWLIPGFDPKINPFFAFGESYGGPHVLHLAVRWFWLLLAMSMFKITSLLILWMKIILVMDSSCKNVAITWLGGDPHNQTPLFNQPGWTWTWQSPPQSQEPVQICRYGRGRKILVSNWVATSSIAYYYPFLYCSPQSFGYLSRPEKEELRRIEQVHVLDKTLTWNLELSFEEWELKLKQFDRKSSCSLTKDDSTKHWWRWGRFDGIMLVDRMMLKCF